MKNNYIAIGIKENEKLYHYAIKVSENDNLLEKLNIKNITHANICKTKKEAEELVVFWNDCAKKNGNYMFSQPF